MLSIPFEKYQGAGNDFVVLSPESASLLPHDSQGLISHEAVARLCDRHFGVGADGLMVIYPGDGDRMPRMEFYNADGYPAQMCGNGARCAILYAQDNRLFGEEIGLQTSVGVLRGKIPEERRIAVQMPDVYEIREEGSSGGLVLNTGVPHLTLEVADLGDSALMATLAPALRRDVERGTGGVNVDFYTEDAGHYAVRTYERGVEGETLACGTGAVAVALSVAYRDEGVRSPVALRPRGGMLAVYFRRAGRGFQDIWLEGPAQRVYNGYFFW